MDLSAKVLSDVSCNICGKQKKYKNTQDYIKLKNKPCRSCANSIARGGLGNVYPKSNTRICIGCNKEKTLESFFKYKNKNRYHSLCFPCKKERYRNYQKNTGRFIKHGLTKEDYVRLSEVQNNRCAICNLKNDNLYIDHNHKTEKIRGLLCRDCNSAIGLFKDNIEFLQNAIQYLKKEI